MVFQPEASLHATAPSTAGSPSPALRNTDSHQRCHPRRRLGLAFCVRTRDGVPRRVRAPISSPAVNGPIQQEPQVCEPSVHDVGDAPLLQLTSQLWTSSAQKTRQSPRHSTTQLSVVAQLTLLLGPIVMAHFCIAKHVKSPLDPPCALQETPSWQVKWQPSPHTTEASVAS